MYVMLCFHRDPVSKQVLTRQRVLELIELLNVGEAIPSERRLSTDLGVSRLTLRAALDDLVRDGYLERRHGSGTFVSEPKIAQQLTLTSFSEDVVAIAVPLFDTSTLPSDIRARRTLRGGRPQRAMHRRAQ